MKKMMLFSCAAAAALSAATAATDALAWDTSKAALVCIVNGYTKIPVGKWVFELNTYTDNYGYEACSYFVKWIDNAFLPMTGNLWLDELITVGFADCWLNSCSSFPTLLFNSPECVSTGFDKFQQKQIVKNLVMSTDGFGKASGVITFNTNFPYPILVQDP